MLLSWRQASAHTIFYGDVIKECNYALMQIMSATVTRNVVIEFHCVLIGFVKYERVLIRMFRLIFLEKNLEYTIFLGKECYLLGQGTMV